MTTLSLGGLSGRLRGIGKIRFGVANRFRGKKAAIESLQRKRQIIDGTMVRLLEEVAEVQARWSQIQVPRTKLEEDRLTSVVARAQLMHRSLMMGVARAETLSISGLNACDADMHAATSLLAKLRLEVRVSDARANDAYTVVCHHPEPSRQLLTA